MADEIEYTFSKIDIVPNNESPYNYIRGYFNNENLSTKFKIVDFPQIKKKLDSLLEDYPDCVFAHSFLFEWYSCENNYIACYKICDLLSDKIDVIRKKYWQWKKLNLSKN